MPVAEAWLIQACVSPVFHELALLQLFPQLAGHLTTQSHALEYLDELLAGLAGAEAPGAREEGDEVDAGMERFAPQLCRSIFFLEILCGVLLWRLLLFIFLGSSLSAIERRAAGRSCRKSPR